MSDSKNSNDEKSFELDHEYDGIHELDHPLPNWWLAIFYITIIYSIFYCGYYLTGIGPTHREELDQALAAIEASKPIAPVAASADENELYAAAQDASRVKHGGEVFQAKCMPCHGDKGQGGIGPNLTDDHWLHGVGSPGDITTSIRDGIAEKGMPPWGPMLSADELKDVVAFIRSIHGSNPPGAKEPQGTQHTWKTSAN